MEATTSKRTAPKAAAAEPKAPKAVLAIAGSDPSGGAGIQADIKTMLANGVYAMSAVTALTAQNTRGVIGLTDHLCRFLHAFFRGNLSARQHFCTGRERRNGFTENGSIIQTPTGPGVRFPAPSLLIWPKGMSWIWRWREQKNIFPEL